MKERSGHFEQLVRDALVPERRESRELELLKARRLMAIITTIGFSLMILEIFVRGQPLSLIACIAVFLSGLVNFMSANTSLSLLRVIGSMTKEIRHEK